MQIIIALLALSLIVIVHELGHFTAAKLLNIKVLEFSLFMGPKLFAFQKGETQYTLRLIPLGGYVRMEGEEEESDDERAFNRQSVWKRAVVVAAGATANLLAAIIILTGMFMSMGYVTTEIGEVREGSPAYNAGIVEGDRLVSYNGKRIYHPSDLDLFAYVAPEKDIEITVERDGKKITNIVTPDRYVYMLGFRPEETTGVNSNIVAEVLEGYPAKSAGILPGDRIVKLNDTEVTTMAEIQRFMKNQSDKVAVTVLRGNEYKVIDVVPVREQNPEYYAIGIGFTGKDANLLGAIKQSFVYTFTIGRSVWYSLVWLITGNVSIKEMMGPVGIVDMIGESVQEGVSVKDILIDLLSKIAFLSINIGLFQFIPFPALDGSKLVLLGVEAIRKKSIPPEKEAYITLAGFVLLIALMIFVTYNDILRLLGWG